jgi:hypothetical protein
MTTLNRFSSALAPVIYACFRALIAFFEFFFVKPVRGARQGVLRAGEVVRAASAGFIIGLIAAVFQFAADNIGLLHIPQDQAELVAKACFAIVTVLQIIMRLAQGGEPAPSGPIPNDPVPNDPVPNDPSRDDRPPGPVVG